MTAADWFRWLPTLVGLVGGPAGAGIVVAWWKHRERTRKQTDGVALEMVQKCQARIDLLEIWVRELQHDLNIALAENDGLFWLLKYAPEDRRAEAVADVEQRRKEKLGGSTARRASTSPTAKGDRANRAQRDLSAIRLAQDDA